MKLLKYAPPVLNRSVLNRYPLDDGVVFFNYGYEEDPPMGVPLDASDEPRRFPIQLYHRTATQGDLSGKRVLEVGCGRGGGALYLVRALHPASYTGVDSDPACIAFCRRKHDLPGLEFLRGDAEKLPFPDQSFDAVINIESSHCYPRFPRFLAEVARVLSPGGHFLYADLRPYVRVAKWEAALADAPMRLHSHVGIEKQVLRVMKINMTKNSQPTVNSIDQRVPSSMHDTAPGATASQGSRLYSEMYFAMRRGDFAYRIYCFTTD